MRVYNRDYHICAYGRAMVETNAKQKQCVHHWIIDSPNGYTSLGVCKHCGAIAEFSNEFKSDFDGNGHKSKSNLAQDN